MALAGCSDGEDVAHLRVERVDLVEEQEAGNAAVLELLEDQLQGRHALGIGLAHHDGGVAGRERERAFVLEFDRAGTIDEGEVVVDECRVGDVELDAHAVVAGLCGRHRRPCSCRDFALPRDGAGAGENGFEKGRLAGEVRPDQCDAAGAAGGRATILPHGILLISPGKRTQSSRAPRLSFTGRVSNMVNSLVSQRKP